MVFRLTNTVNAKLAANPGLARTVLSLAEYKAGQNYPSVARLEYGRAVENLVARDIRKSPILSYLYEYTGRRPSSPDFVGQHLFSGLNFEITTNTSATILEHQLRPYGPGLIFSTYVRPDYFRLFP